jgi:peptidoglycan/LPS O-acetylase OafA/YrhL
MGMVRTLLALAVVLDHAAAFAVVRSHTPIFGLFPVTAVLAVQMFFVISGFYMSLVLTEKYRAHSGWVWRFYVSRYLRLWPPYLVALISTALVWTNNIGDLSWGPWQHNLFKLSGFSLIGIDLTAFYTIGTGYEAHGQLPIQQAWSLGTELWFYLLVPALALVRTRWLVALGGALLAARIAAMTLPSFPWQQRLFPLELYFFVLGMLAHRAYAATLSGGPIFGRTTLALAVALVVFSHYSETFGGWTPVNALILTAALATLLPFVFAYCRASRVDRTIGDFSYPIYLVHMTVLAAVPLARAHIGLTVLLVLAAAVPLVFLVERPIDRWRARLLEPRVHRTAHALAAPSVLRATAKPE